MPVEQGALSQLRAATDPDARGGTLYGPAFVGFGPPIRKPLFPLGTKTGVQRLWQFSAEATGVPLQVAA